MRSLLLLWNILNKFNYFHIIIILEFFGVLFFAKRQISFVMLLLFSQIRKDVHELGTKFALGAVRKKCQMVINFFNPPRFPFSYISFPTFNLKQYFLRLIPLIPLPLFHWIFKTNFANNPHVSTLKCIKLNNSLLRRVISIELVSFSNHLNCFTVYIETLASSMRVTFVERL